MRKFNFQKNYRAFGEYVRTHTPTPEFNFSVFNGCIRTL